MTDKYESVAETVCKRRERTAVGVIGPDFCFVRWDGGQTQNYATIIDAWYEANRMLEKRDADAKAAELIEQAEEECVCTVATCQKKHRTFPVFGSVEMDDIDWITRLEYWAG